MSSLFSHKNIHKWAVLSVAQCFQEFRFSLSFLFTTCCLIDFIPHVCPFTWGFKVAATDPDIMLFPSIDEECIWQGRKWFSRKSQKMALSRTGYKNMRKSLFHLSPLYSRRWIRKKIRHAFWVNKTYYLQSANVDFHISILHIVQFISTYWWIDGFSALLLIHTQTASNPFTFSKDRSLLDNIFNPFVFSYIHISQSCRKNKKFPWKWNKKQKKQSRV